MKLVLVESDYHRHRDKPLVIGGIVYKVYQGEERLTEQARLRLGEEDTRGTCPL